MRAHNGASAVSAPGNCSTVNPVGTQWPCRILAPGLRFEQTTAQIYPSNLLRIDLDLPAHAGEKRISRTFCNQIGNQRCSAGRETDSTSNCALCTPANFASGMEPHRTRQSRPRQRLCSLHSSDAQEIQRGLQRSRFRAQKRLGNERRHAGRRAVRELTLGKSTVIEPRKRCKQRVPRIACLYEYLARLAARPARPATCIRMANKRSGARKSCATSCASAFSTATSATRRKSWPLAIICVPTSTSTAPA